jgi:nucleoside-diphosphate-sugar epimerase
MNVLILGGTGAVGIRAVKALVAAGHQVASTARSAKSREQILALGAQPADIDIYDSSALQRAMTGCDAVVRLTTKLPKSVTGMRTKAAWDETNRLRTIGAQRAVDAAIAAGVKIYITESFFAAYRSSGDTIVTEETPSDDDDLPTMKALLETEHQAQRFTSAGGRGIALRFGGFYSADHPMTQELRHMLEKRWLPVIGRGEYFYPSVHLDDAARAIVSALSAPAGIYNVCDDTPVRWAEFLDGFAQIIGAPRPMRVPALLGPLAIGYPWRWMSRSVRMSNSKFKLKTAWQPRYRDVFMGLRDTQTPLSPIAP